MKERLRKRERLDDKGLKHALIITLFNAKKESRAATFDELITNISNERSSECPISRAYLGVIITDVRKVLEETEYRILNVRGFGYKIVKKGER